MVQTKDIFDQITYRKVWTGRAVDKTWTTHSFRYVQNSGGALVNSSTLLNFPSTAFPPGGPISKSGFVLGWGAVEPMGQDSLRVLWNNVNQYSGSILVEDTSLASASTQGTIGVTAEKLQSFDVGRTYYLQLCRVRKLPLEQKTAAGGNLTLISCSPRKSIVLQP